MPRVELVKDPERYFRLLTCQSTQVKNIQFVNDECVEVYYTQGDGFVPMSDKTNVVIAAFTTAHARMKLYSVLERLQGRVLYFDTDSVIFTSQPDEWIPPLGDYLGELTNELDDGDYITTFAAGGPKNYTYQTKNGKTVCKVRGFTSIFVDHRSSTLKPCVVKSVIQMENQSIWRTLISSNVMRKQRRFIQAS